jgi:PST family polysaccharide transporter
MVKIACGVVLNKILSFYVGPSGYAVIGQFQNALGVASGLTGGLISQGVTKLTAQHKCDRESQINAWRTAVQLSVACTLLIGAFVLLFRKWISELVLCDMEMSGLCVWLALCLPAIVAANLLLAVINGMKEINVYVISNVTSSLLALLLGWLLAKYFALYGALLALVVTPAVSCFTTVVLVLHRPWFRIQLFWGRGSVATAYELGGFAVMGATSAIAIPITYMVIRDSLVSQFGLSAAGYWQATSNISGMLAVLTTSTLSVYYLPRLAEIGRRDQLVHEIIAVYKFIIPIVVLGAIVIYGFRHFVILMLFTRDFLPMRDLLGWQLLGDGFKISSWVLGYVLVGRCLVKTFIVSEILFSLLLVGLTDMFTARYGLSGASIAYAVNYAIHLIAMTLLMHRELGAMEKS